MNKKTINYDDKFMCVVNTKHKSYFRSFRQDYRLRSLVRLAHVTKGNMLDVGCGGGLATESFPYYFPHMHIHGVDVSQSALYYAKKYGSGKITYKVIKRGRIPYKKNFFDLCVCNDVLEHVPNVSALLHEVHRVLKPSGTLFLVVPCEGQVGTFTWLLQKLHIGQNMTYTNFGHIHPEFTHERVKKLIIDHGFTIDSVGYSEHIFTQLHHIFLYFIPKAIAECIYGKAKVSEYSESNLIRSPKESSDTLGLFQRLLMNIISWMTRYPIYTETVLFHRIPYGAWKIILVVHKNNSNRV